MSGKLDVTPYESGLVLGLLMGFLGALLLFKVLLG